MIAQTPQPPYYAVIFSSLRTQENNGYAAMAKQMEELAQQQPGYLYYESAREQLGITVSYWQSIEAIKNWKQVSSISLLNNWVEKNGTVNIKQEFVW
jgi:antibiotic biosynthesis monooxygenase (ABM) superfamily enzyme